jgi:hypothetical protein
MDKYTRVNFDDLIVRGVTHEQINRVGYDFLDYEHPTILDNKVVMEWYYSETQPGLMSTKRIGIMASRKILHWLVCGPDDYPESAWVHDQLAKWIISEAHAKESCLKGLNKVTELMYRKLGADIRGKEAVALIDGPLGVVIYRAPKWRESNDDCGEDLALNKLEPLLSEYVPAKVLPHVVSQINAYVSTWNEIYGGPVELSSFTKSVLAGSHLYVVVGNAGGAVDFKFSWCEGIDRDTLKPSAHIQSILKDFK